MAEGVLLLDVGNSRIKWAWWQKENIPGADDVQHADSLSPDVLSKIELPQTPDKILASCVAGGEVRQNLQQWAGGRWQRRIEFLTSPASAQGIVNGYAEPERLGSDRWAAIVAARQDYRGYLCIVDAGSALTLDLLRPDGQHLGGYILPGIKHSTECVLATTGIELPAEEIVAPDSRKPGNSTSGCLASGALHMACSVVENTVAQLEDKVKQQVQCILTGGDSGSLSSGLTLPHVIEPALVIKGLAYIVQNSGETP